MRDHWVNGWPAALIHDFQVSCRTQKGDHDAVDRIAGHRVQSGLEAGAARHAGQDARRRVGAVALQHVPDQRVRQRIGPHDVLIRAVEQAFEHGRRRPPAGDHLPREARPRAEAPGPLGGAGQTLVEPARDARAAGGARRSGYAPLRGTGPFRASRTDMNLSGRGRARRHPPPHSRKRPPRAAFRARAERSPARAGHGSARRHPSVRSAA